MSPFPSEGAPLSKTLCCRSKDDEPVVFENRRTKRLLILRDQHWQFPGKPPASWASDFLFQVFVKHYPINFVSAEGIYVLKMDEIVKAETSIKSRHFTDWIRF